jgi:hypothetical protein
MSDIVKNGEDLIRETTYLSNKRNLSPKEKERLRNLFVKIYPNEFDDED